MCFYTKTEYEEDEKVTDVDRKPDPSSRPCSYIAQWAHHTASHSHSDTAAGSPRRSNRSHMLYK